MREPEGNPEEALGGYTAGVSSRVLKEIIRTPAFQEIIKTNLFEPDPDEARRLVRTALWEDPNLSLSLMGTSPSAVNYVIEAVLELGKQLNQFPADLLNGFMSSIASDIRHDALREIPVVYGQLLEKVVAGNPELRGRLAGTSLAAIPYIANTGLRLTGALVASIEGLEPEARSALLKEALAGLDGEAVGQTANSISRLLMTVHSENPRLISEVFPAIDVAMSEADFGKIREAVGALIDSTAAAALKVLEASTDNPVIIANIVGMVPPLANSVIKIVSGLLEKLELPPEILASALFNTLTALDFEELGRAFSTLSKHVNDLHAGNLILGGDEPRARAVTDGIVRRLLDNLDIESVAGAVVALGEDAEVITGVLSDIVSRDPGLIDVLTGVAVELTNITTRVVANVLREAAGWPDDVLVRMGRDGRSIDTVDIGRAIDSFVTYALRLRAANPGLHGEIYSRALEAVNTEQAERHLRAVAGDLIGAAASNAGIRKALEPEEVGARVNEMLAGFNRMVKPTAMKDYLSRVFSAIDSRELETAMKNATGGLIDAFFASSRVARSVLKAAGSGALRLMKNIFGFLAKK